MALQVRKAGGLERGVMVGLLGDRGAGKTTTAATFPNPLCLAVEDGTQSLAEFGTAVVDVRPVKGRKFKDVIIGLLREIAEADEYRTIILDSGTALLSRLTHDLVKDEKPNARSLAAALGGYMRARDVLVNEVEEIVNACLWLARERKTHIVFLFHTKLRTVSMPDRDDYECIDADGQKEAIAAILNPMDVVGIVEQTMESMEKGGKTLVHGDGSRQLLVGPHPAMKTKSRYHRTFETIPIEFGVNPLKDIVKG